MMIASISRNEIGSWPKHADHDNYQNDERVNRIAQAKRQSRRTQ